MPPSNMSKFNFKISARLRLVLVSLIVVAGLMRIVYFYEINNSPLISQHVWEQTDMNYFDQWAKDIADGDWLSEKSSHPFHIWHRLIAEDYFRTEPDTAKKYIYAGAAMGVEPRRLLWNHWYGEKIFHQEPLYTYMIAITYKLFGSDVRWVFCWQMILGILSILLIFTITRRHFEDSTAIVAVGLAVLCGPLLYSDMILERSTLITFVTLMLVDLTDRTWEKETVLGWFLVGVACGAAILLKSTFALYWFGVLAAVGFRHYKTPQLLLQRVTGLLAGAAIAISPAIARNVIVEAPPFSLSSVGAITFVIDNSVDFTPKVGFYVGKYASAIMGKSDGHMLPAIIETLRTHSGPLSYLSLLSRKLSVMWHWYEIPDNTNYYFYAQHASLLRYLLTFFLLGPLSVLGLVLAFSRIKSIWTIFLMTFFNILMMLVFHVTSRFRVSLIAVLLPFSAFALARMFAWIQARDFRRLVLSLIAVVLLFFAMEEPLLPEGFPLIRSADYMSTYNTYYDPKIEQAFNNNDWQSVIDTIKDSLRFEPAEVSELGAVRAAANNNEIELARFYSEVYQNYALALRHEGQTDEAALQERRATELLRAAGGVPGR